MTRCERCGENVRTLGDYLGEGMCSACFRGDRCARELIDEWWEVHSVGRSRYDARESAIRYLHGMRKLKYNARLVHVRRYRVVRA